jgi:hypothetical protein
MCTVTVNIDEDLLRNINPNLTNSAAIRDWAQQLIDSRIRTMQENKELYQERDMTVEELYQAIEQDVKDVYAEQTL